QAVTTLRAMPAASPHPPARPPPAPPLELRDADVAPDANLGAAASPGDAPAAAPLVAAAPSVVPSERYRRARLLRAQGDAARARAELVVLVREADPTWAPLAEVEMARIDLDALAQPERAVADCDAFLARWSAHPLAADVRTLRCRALAQLGRGC